MIKCGTRVAWLCLVSVGAAAGSHVDQIPRFEDYPTADFLKGEPAEPKLTSPEARMFRSRIREGVRRGPNFAGRYIVIQWGCGSPCLRMAVVDAETGDILSPPITASGGKSGFALPLLTLGRRVSRNPEVDFRLDSRLMVIRATPQQTQAHPSYEYYFLRSAEKWTLLKRVRLKDDAALRGDQ